MAHAQKPDLVFRRNGRVHLNWRGASVQSTSGSQVVRISGSDAGYTMFRGSVKGTSYPLHSPVSPFTSSPVRHRVPSHFINWTLRVIWLEWGSFHETVAPEHVMLMTNRSFDRLPYCRCTQHFTDGHIKVNCSRKREWISTGLYHQLWHSKIVHVTDIALVCCVAPQNKQHILPHSSLTDLNLK